MNQASFCSSAARALAVTVCVIYQSPLYATTLGAVFGPGISQGQSMQYRGGFAGSDNGRESRYAHRVHFNTGVSENSQARLILVGNDFESGDQEFVFAQLEISWRIRPFANTNRSSALRFDIRHGDNDDGADRIGLNWTNQWNVSDRDYLRFIVLTAREFGAQSRSGTIIETRAEWARKFDNVQLGVSSFNPMGRIGNHGSFNSQSHRLGPFVSGKLGSVWTYLLGSQFGLSRAANDIELRATIGRAF